MGTIPELTIIQYHHDDRQGIQNTRIQTNINNHTHSTTLTENIQIKIIVNICHTVYIPKLCKTILLSIVIQQNTSFSYFIGTVGINRLFI